MINKQKTIILLLALFSVCFPIQQSYRVISLCYAEPVQTAEQGILFDGLEWYDSHSPTTMSINQSGQLVWIPANDHQIITRIPDLDLNDVGDVVEIAFLWMSDGQGNIEGCDDCQNEETCNFNKDITCVSGTGDFRVGLFESDGEFVDQHGLGLENSIFAGYKGYKFCMQPHVPEEPVRWQEASGEPHIAGGFYERDMVDDPRLLSVNVVCDRISMFGGYNLPLGEFSLWKMKLERISATSIEMSMTLNGITYTDIDTTDSPSIPQPKKIDVLAICFPNPNPFSHIVLDKAPTDCNQDFTNDQRVDAEDLAVLSSQWLDANCVSPVTPRSNRLVLKYSFDGMAGLALPDSLTDDTNSYNATIIPGTDPESTIVYALGIDPTDSNCTSALFENFNYENNAGDALLIPDINGIDFSAFNGFTFDFFVYPSSTGIGQTRRLFSEYVNAYMNLDADNNLHARRKYGPGDWDENSTHLEVSGFPCDQWSHIAFVWDPYEPNERLKLYVDGILSASETGSIDATVDSTAGFTIGSYQRENGSTAQFFDGKIDNFSLYSYALSPAEVAYTCGNCCVPVKPLMQCDLDADGRVNFKDFADFASCPILIIQP